MHNETMDVGVAADHIDKAIADRCRKSEIKETDECLLDARAKRLCWEYESGTSYPNIVFLLYNSHISLSYYNTNIDVYIL